MSEEYLEQEPRAGLFFYDEENAMLMVFDKDLNPNEVAEIYADSPCGFIMAESLNRRASSASDKVVEGLREALRLVLEACPMCSRNSPCSSAGCQPALVVLGKSTRYTSPTVLAALSRLPAEPEGKPCDGHRWIGKSYEECLEYHAANGCPPSPGKEDPR